MPDQLSERHPWAYLDDRPSAAARRPSRRRDGGFHSSGCLSSAIPLDADRLLRPRRSAIKTTTGRSRRHSSAVRQQTRVQRVGLASETSGRPIGMSMLIAAASGDVVSVQPRRRAPRRRASWFESDAEPLAATGVETMFSQSADAMRERERFENGPRSRAVARARFGKLQSPSTPDVRRLSSSSSGL